MNYRDKLLEKEHEVDLAEQKVQELEVLLAKAQDNREPENVTLQMPVAGDDPNDTKPLTVKRSTLEDGVGSQGFVIPISIVSSNRHPNIRITQTALGSVSATTRLLTPTPPGTGDVTVSGHTIQLGYTTVGAVHNIIYFSDSTYVRSDQPTTAYYNAGSWNVTMEEGTTGASFTPKIAVLKADSTFTSATLIALAQTLATSAASASKSVATGAFAGTLSLTATVTAQAILEAFTLSTLTYNDYAALSKESIGDIGELLTTATTAVAWGDVGGVTPDGSGDVSLADQDAFNLDLVRNWTPVSGTVYGIGLELTLALTATGDFENEIATTVITIPSPRVSNKPFVMQSAALV